MGDRYGLVTAPVAPAGADEAAGDPALTHLAEFLRAWLNANAMEAFGHLMPRLPPCREAFCHDPEEVSFNERDLPAIFVWREGGNSERIADDYHVETSELALLWVVPPSPQAKQRIRQPFANAIWKLVDMGIERGRAPGFVVAGDSDPRAASEGSLIYGYLGAWSIDLRRRRRRTFVEAMSDSPARRYPAVEMTLELRELQEYDLGRYAPMPITNQTTAFDPNGEPLVKVRY
ncbi:hypothetical protein LZC95_19870 [Pendulispora brunnea]|uniref:Uncharacterized protein n=1 Tax=Pendulispora brunnea TaxID=2905690 RepID=A0ABZ2KN13_9BACT